MSVSSSGAIATTGNVAGTASYASNAELFDGLDSTVFTLTSSFAAQTASFTAFSSSVNTFTASQNILNGTYATTGSNTFAGVQTINSNLVVTGSITAQTLVVQTITSSVDFVTGSTRFGSILGNTHVFSGSITMNPGGLFVSSSGNVGIGTTPNTTAGITELAIGSSNTNPLISGIRDGVSAFSLSSDSGGTRLLERRNLELTIGTNNTTRLTIASTGAATFSSTVQANGAFRQFATTGYYSDFAYNGTTYNLGSGETTDNIDFKIAGGGAFTSGGNFRWFTQTGGATPIQALKITPSGNLEIGTSSKASFSYLALINDANTNGGVIAIARTAGQFLTAAGAGDMIIGNSTGENILFGNGQTGTTEYMRISSAGNVLIGKTTDDGQKLQVNGAVRTDNVGLIRAGSFRGGLYTYDAVTGAGTDYGITIFAEGGTGNGNIYFCPNGSVTKAMTINANGIITIANLAAAGSRTVLADSSGNLSAPVSDISVKQNITSIGYGLNEILKMNPVWFNFINEYKNYGEGRQNGNIAQEMELIIPEAVFTTPTTGKMGINYDQLHAVYIKAIQELKAENDTLKEILQRNNIQ
jgi:hypothetical protein